MSTGKDNLLNAWRTPYGASIFQVRVERIVSEDVYARCINIFEPAYKYMCVHVYLYLELQSHLLVAVDSVVEAISASCSGTAHTHTCTHKHTLTHTVSPGGEREKKMREFRGRKRTINIFKFFFIPGLLIHSDLQRFIRECRLPNTHKQTYKLAKHKTNVIIPPRLLAPFEVMLKHEYAGVQCF